ncbi:MAG: HEPN domain-containing protein [Candidatus Eisenbacteria bacterium]
MRPDVVREVREWLERAGEDLREAEHALTATPPLLRGAVFHCQQAAEKTLKAFLVAHERPFRKTHDLDELGNAVAALDATLADVVDRAKDLTPYAWRFRYPGTPVDPSAEEAREALTLAREVHEAVLERLPEEVRP